MEIDFLVLVCLMINLVFVMCSYLSSLKRYRSVVLERFMAFLLCYCYSMKVSLGKSSFVVYLKADLFLVLLVNDLQQTVCFLLFYDCFSRTVDF